MRLCVFSFYNFKRQGWSKADRPSNGPMETWSRNTWLGIQFSSPSTRHTDLYKDGNDKPPPGSYAPKYALPGNRESLQMTLFRAFENACFLVYERAMILFHLAESSSAEEGGKKKDLDLEEDAIAADYKKGQMEDTEGEDTTEPTNLGGYYADDGLDADLDQADEHTEETEIRDISRESVDGFVSKIFSGRSSPTKSPSAAFSPPSSPGRAGGAAAKHSLEGVPEPVSPASLRKRQPGKFMMLSTHNTCDLEKQNQQTIYYVTGAGLHEALARLWHEPHVSPIINMRWCGQVQPDYTIT